MEHPRIITQIAQSIAKSKGRTLLVGGAVRDSLLGLEPKDWDIEVYGVTPDKLLTIAKTFGTPIEVGKSFGVIKLNTAYGEELDITIPRRETKTGTGHTGFEIEPDPFMTVKEAMERRDFTFNAIGYDPLTTDILDPYNGANDLKNRLLRPVSNRFKEDPLRVIRAMQFAGRFNLHTTPELNSMSQEVKSSFKELAAERVFQEWRKWAVKSTHPSKGLDVLDQTGWLEHFPELQALKNCPQDPKWHPEGDVFTHTKHCCDALAELDFFKNSSPDQKEILMLTILGHDFGKPAKTKKEPDGRITAHGHEPAGAAPMKAFLKRMKAPHKLQLKIIPLIKAHLIHASFTKEKPSKAAIQRLAKRLHPANIEELACIIQADHNGRPPLPKKTIPGLENIIESAREHKVEEAPPEPWVRGRDLIKMGMPPGPKIGEILKETYQAQMDNQAASKEDAIQLAREKITGAIAELNTQKEISKEEIN